MAVDATKRYQAWLENPLIDAKTKLELRELADNQGEIEDRFFKWLEFGTGGLRGTIGAGSNRMNIYTVRLVTQALANCLEEQKKASGGVAIAYDSRRMSKEFAQAAAGVLVANGIPVYVFPEVAPTPLLSFAVRHLSATAGIVITASHNPPQYNGYKVYNEQGNQVLPYEAFSISSEMTRLGLDDVKLDANPEGNLLFQWIGQEVIDAYYTNLLAIAPQVEPGKLRILYTPLHGSGGRFVPEILQRAGFTNVVTVPEQQKPDGDFPTVNSPNPEDPEAFRLAFEKAAGDNFHLIIATDPDADRMGVAVKQGSEWVLLNGNQVGILLSDFLLSHLSPDRQRRATILKTIVTTEMVHPIAAKFGAEVRNTLTGFKYIGSLIDKLPPDKKEFAFGFEESFGYLAGTHVRDKDAVQASLFIALLAAFYQQGGLTLVDRLEELFLEHGYYLQEQVSYTFSTSLEAERSRQFIGELQKNPLSVIGTEAVVEVLDYEASIHKDLRTQTKTAIHLPKEGVLQLITEAGSKVTLRPSGTEPKMKLYLEVKDTSRSGAEQRLIELKTAVDQLIKANLEA